jgi:hypothetical protein
MITLYGKRVSIEADVKQHDPRKTLHVQLRRPVDMPGGMKRWGRDVDGVKQGK